MTGRNPNVFYEVGYAHALGKIVLLLTQNTDDIPFDLKHRQHIVYGGKIETLRKELTTKLAWAISESQKQGTQDLTEQFSISILGVEVPHSSSSEAAAIINGLVYRPNFRLTVFIRNDSIKTTTAITHIYFFTTANSALVPYDPFDFANITTFSASRVGQPLPETPIQAFDARPGDSSDGLTKQYRLKSTVPPLPPGAIEQFSIDLKFAGKPERTDALFRLRIHSSANYHDFPFRLKLLVDIKDGTEKPEAADKKES